MTALQKVKNKAKSGSVKLGTVKVGLPGSDSYHAKTPKGIKIVSESLIFIGGSISILAGAVTLNPVLIALGGICTLGGRFAIKCFSVNK